MLSTHMLAWAGDMPAGEVEDTDHTSGLLGEAGAIMI